MTNFSHRQIDLSGGLRIGVETAGNPRGAPVVFSHAILTSSVMWRAQASLLADHGFRVLLLDTRGHGSSTPLSAPYAIEDLADDVVRVLDALDIQRAHFVGLSLGGMTGFSLGIRHPARIASLVLCDARADAPASYAAPWDERIDIARQYGCGALAESTVERWFGKDFLASHPYVKAQFVELIAGTSVEGFAGCARAIQKLDLLDQVDRIKVPTTLVVGAKDGVLPEAMSELAKRLPQAVLDVIPAAGHLPNIDQPVAFNASLLGHFERYKA
ncbi:alpha/beta fold hydrolase [Noviherbaspirillum denitrificans]|uniref:AB hydrolase-1 domain-containing protein n=1 Tax=Noviherbaspirillum denitrificans TaxID=1968433 RepID=A0A254TL58_9BURK|nr:alpha/beta hydrolase [Noviherbaspirillum denitrificans]OWW20448.1 hypothetical protein AYR66_14085 [Noviherbaspirillum denitrificans]